MIYVLGSDSTRPGPLPSPSRTGAAAAGDRSLGAGDWHVEGGSWTRARNPRVRRPALDVFAARWVSRALKAFD